MAVKRKSLGECSSKKSAWAMVVYDHPTEECIEIVRYSKEAALSFVVDKVLIHYDEVGPLLDLLAEHRDRFEKALRLGV